MINRIGAGALLAALVVSQRTDAQALKIKSVPGPTVPTDLIYAVCISALPVTSATAEALWALRYRNGAK